MCIIYKASKIRHKKYKNIFALSIKMLNLLKNELILIAKKKSISGYKSMSRNELINAIKTSEPAKNNRKKVITYKF